MKAGRLAGSLSDRRGRYIAAALFLLAIALLAVLFRDMARQIVVLPALYLFWLLGLLGRSIPQALIWGIFVIVALRVAVGALLVRRRRIETLPHHHGTEHWGRARTWSKWVELSAHGGYDRRRLARQLSELALAVLAQREYLPPDQARAALEAGTLAVPPAVRAYLLAALATPPARRLAWLRERLWGRPNSLELETAEIVRFLENATGENR